MVQKQDCSAVRIVWPTNKPGYLEDKRCVRGEKNPQKCLMCHFFAGICNGQGKLIEWFQRWVGDKKRLASYIQCGAPKEAKKKLLEDQDGVVGISPKHKDFDTEKNRLRSRELTKQKRLEEEALETKKVAEGQTSQASEQARGTCQCLECVKLLEEEGKVHLSDCRVHPDEDGKGGPCDCEPVEVAEEIQENEPTMRGSGAKAETVKKQGDDFL